VRRFTQKYSEDGLHKNESGTNSFFDVQRARPTLSMISEDMFRMPFIIHQWLRRIMTEAVIRAAINKFIDRIFTICWSLISQYFKAIVLSGKKKNNKI
jgi:hypothetical protein